MINNLAIKTSTNNLSNSVQTNFYVPITVCYCQTDSYYLAHVNKIDLILDVRLYTE